MRRVVLFAALLVVLLAWPAAASAVVVKINDPIFEFSKSGPGASGDWFQGLAVSSGGLYVVGTMSSATHGQDGYVARFSDVHGWAHRYDGPTHSGDHGEAIVACPTGGAYVAFSSPNGAGDSDIVVARYGPGGARLWAHRWGGPSASHDYAHLIARDAAGNVYVAGRSLPGIVLLKYRPNGSRAWASTYRPAGLDASVADLYVAGNGSAYLAGTVGVPWSATDSLLLKYSSAGKRLWTRKPNATPGLFERITALCRCPSGGVYAVGSTGASGGDADAMIYRFDSYGNQRLFARFGTSDGEDQVFNDCAVDSHGRIAVCGAWGTSFSGDQFWTALLSTSGVIRWQIIDGNLFDDEARLLVVDSLDRVTVAGTFSVGGARDEQVVHAFKATGVPRWSSIEGAPDGSVRPFGMARRGSSNVYVCGEKALAGFDWAGLVLGWNLTTP